MLIGVTASQPPPQLDHTLDGRGGGTMEPYIYIYTSQPWGEVLVVYSEMCVLEVEMMQWATRIFSRFGVQRITHVVPAGQVKALQGLGRKCAARGLSTTTITGNWSVLSLRHVSTRRHVSNTTYQTYNNKQTMRRLCSIPPHTVVVMRWEGPRTSMQGCLDGDGGRVVAARLSWGGRDQGTKMRGCFEGVGMIVVARYL